MILQPAKMKNHSFTKRTFLSVLYLTSLPAGILKAVPKDEIRVLKSYFYKVLIKS